MLLNYALIPQARLVCAFLLLPLLATLARSQPVESIWRGEISDPRQTGKWSQESDWRPVGVVPNNEAGVEFRVVVPQSVLTTDIPVEVSELVIDGGQLELDQPLLTGSMHMISGSVGGPGKLAVSGDLILYRGSINNTSGESDGFDVGGSVIKRGFSGATLAPFDGGDYEIVIEQGRLSYRNRGLGSDVGVVTIASPEFARLHTYDLSAMSDDVYMNNARGFAGTGALISQTSRSSVLGDLYLGDTGSVIGLQGNMTLYGSVHGGTLDIVGRGTIFNESDSHAYTGPTRIGSGAALLLRNDGALPSTSAIEIGGGASLYLDNEDQTLNDRLPDSAPVVLRGGTLELESLSSSTVSERVGVFQLVQGASTVSTGGWRANWLSSALQRSGLATVNFSRRDDYTPDGPSIMFDQAPTLANGILGGWATEDNSDFATYDPAEGIVPLGDRVARAERINDAGPNDHVLYGGSQPPIETLTADRTIGTLVVESFGLSELDLGGHTLTLRDGGFLFPGDNSLNFQLRSGQITAGEGSDPAALYMHSSYRPLHPRRFRFEVSASITDNLHGAPVSVVKSGNFEYVFTGDNTYTGTTSIQDGTIVFENEGALPSGGELDLDGGSALLLFEPTEAKHLSRFSIRQNGYIFSPEGTTDSVSDVELDADEYLLESGRIFVSFTGDGAMRKTTEGIVSMRFGSPTYSGSVVVENGTLIAGSSTSVVNPTLPLGTGITSVLPGAKLVHGKGSQPLFANLDLAGGDIGLTVTTAINQIGFNGTWEVTAPSRLLLFDTFGDDDFRSSSGNGFGVPAVTLQGDVSFRDGSGLTVLGDGSVDFQRGLAIDGDTELNVETAHATIGSISAYTEGSVLQLSGMGNVLLPRSLAVVDGSPFRVVVQPESTVELPRGLAFMNEGIELEVNGDLIADDALVLLGGELSGSGRVGRVRNVVGRIAPGTSIGVLFAAHVEQEPEGTLEFEIQGGVSPQSDQLFVESANLEGVLSASLLPGRILPAGSYFDLVVAETLVVGDLTLETAGFNARLELVSITDGAYDGRQALRLLIVPEPAGLVLAASAMAANARKRRRMRPCA